MGTPPNPIRYTAALISIALTVLLVTGCGPIDKKKHVVLYGDSLSVESGPYLGAAITKLGKVTFVNRAMSGTAPCDWRARIKADVRSHRPDAVVIQVYGNNSSSCQVGTAGLRPKFDSPNYWTMYRKDFLRTVRLFPRSTKIILSAAPAARNDRASGLSHKAKMFSIMRGISNRYRNVSAYDAGSKVESPVGRFTRQMPCAKPGPCPNHPILGTAVVRARDGLHFCPPMVWAKIALLQHCPVVAYGAWRFGLAEAVAVARSIGVVAMPPPLTKL